MLIADIPQAYLGAFILQIAALLMDGAGGNKAEAREAACRMLSSYEPRNEVELRLAVRIIAFNLQIGAALAQAADPATPLLRVIRLRSGAVSMAREAEKAERRLEKLRADAVTAPVEDSVPAVVEVETAAEAPQSGSPKPAPAEQRQTVGAYAKAHGLTRKQVYQERNLQKRLARRAQQERQAAAA